MTQKCLPKKIHNNTYRFWGLVYLGFLFHILLKREDWKSLKLCKMTCYVEHVKVIIFFAPNLLQCMTCRTFFWWTSFKAVRPCCACYFFTFYKEKVHTKLWKILLSHLECFFGSCDLEISVIFFILVYFKICRGNWKWNMLRNGLHKLFKKARCRLGSEAIMKLFRTFWVFLKILI